MLKKYNAKQTILTDCDGVLLDWETAFHDWMERRGYAQENPGYYEMNHVYGVDQKKIMRLITEFNNSSAMSKLKSMFDARTGVATLLDHGYKFVCITSLSLEESSAEERWRNLHSVFGTEAVVDMICLDTGAPKEKALADFAYDNFWWIEDKPENANEGLNHNMKPILINQPYNKEADVDDGVVRVNNWKEIVEVILNDD